MGCCAFGYDIVNSVKVPHEEEQVVMCEMVKMRELGIGYRGILDWMSQTKERRMTFIRVRRTFVEALTHETF